MYFIRLGGSCCAEMWGMSQGLSPHLNTQPSHSHHHPRTWPSGSEDLAVDDVPREDPPVGAFEVTLGALHLDSNDTNALGSGWGVPRA